MISTAIFVFRQLLPSRTAAHRRALAEQLVARAGNLRLSVIRGVGSMPRAETRARVDLARRLESAALVLGAR